VEFHIATRRFVCDVPRCSRRIFAERFGAGVLADRSRRTARLDRLVYHLGLALGGKPAARLSRRLMLPVSHDTLRRTVRRHTRAPTQTLNVVGIDDWSWQRNYRYGSIVCDLERRSIVALLPDRAAATVAAWLADHRGITVISRDRGGGYGEAAARALPNALQVADRWHLMENASGAFLDAIRKSMREIRRSVGNATVKPALLTRAERLQDQGYLRREETRIRHGHERRRAFAQGDRSTLRHQSRNSAQDGPWHADRYVPPSRELPQSPTCLSLMPSGQRDATMVQSCGAA
jgi:hypothetical protein